MRIFVFLIIFILCLASCARIPKKDLQAKLYPAVSVERTADEALSSNDFEKGGWPDDHWWEMFDDPQLTLLVTRVLENNPTMGIAKMRAKKALDEAHVVRAALFPHLNSEAAVNWEHLSDDNLYRFPPSRIPSVIYQLTLGLALTYEFDIWGKNRHRYAAAIGEAKTALAESAMTRLQLSTSAAAGYFNLQTLIKKEKLLKDLIRSEKELLELSEKRFLSGLNNQINVDEARTRLFKVEETLIFNTELITLGKNFLRTLMGDSPDSEEGMIEPSASFDQKFPLPENLTLNLLARRPDITARVWQVEKTAHLIGAAKTLFYPDVTLTAMGGLESLAWNMFFTKNSLAGSLNPAIHLPIFVGGKLRANLDARVAEFEEAVYEYNHTLLVAAEEVANRISKVQSTTDRMRKQIEVVRSIGNVYDLMFARYKVGLDSRIGVLEKEIELLDEEIKKIELQGERLDQVAGLIKALGGGYEDLSHKQAEWECDAAKACAK